MKEKNINGYPFQLYKRDSYDAPQMIKRSADFLRFMDKRRSVRDFSKKAVPSEVIENILLTASSSPSCAHKQPWTFCAVSNPGLKHDIRMAAEKEEQVNYDGRLSKELLSDLKPLQTGTGKPYIDDAPWLIVVCKRNAESSMGSLKDNYNVEESIGIATGILLSAIHNAGLAALPHGVGQFGFLKEKLGRPATEEPFLMIPVGYPAEECYVPKLIRKGLKDIAVFYEE